MCIARARTCTLGPRTPVLPVAFVHPRPPLWTSSGRPGPPGPPAARGRRPAQGARQGPPLERSRSDGARRARARRGPSRPQTGSQTKRPGSGGSSQGLLGVLLHHSRQVEIDALLRSLKLRFLICRFVVCELAITGGFKQLPQSLLQGAVYFSTQPAVASHRRR